MKQKKGFTLVELLVVVAIISILSVSATVGFNVFGDVLKNKLTAGAIEDAIKRTELSLVRGENSKATLHFFPDYLVSEEIVEGASLGLKLGSACTDGYNIEATGATLGVLKVFNENEERVLNQPINGDTTLCIAFKNAKDTEWKYVMTEGIKTSNVVRFMHFNLDRDNTMNPVKIALNAGNDGILQIEGQNAKKTGTIILTLSPAGGLSELPITINP